LNDLTVSCYSGHTYAERPQSFLWQGQEYRVEEIEKEWREPGTRNFLVRTEEKQLFRLCYNQAEDRWSAEEIKRG